MQGQFVAESPQFAPILSNVMLPIFNVILKLIPFVVFGCITMYLVVTGPNQTWEMGRVSMTTRRYVGTRENKITTEYEQLSSLICFVNQFPKTKWRKYPQYISE